ncbi:hypothetical protein [Streptomyces benahoarensis]|uniref:Uncharacterized protein n=1 Tax=Streptomyces benahoarensis TaxID=2595054 RepID=A0A553ZH20_9ACTN|nr:hypothetical protein [Streptomyces benahoarensis]TSB21536.1 hypothetical protein FNJ62_18220 [Streptomyces benahoarensis]TSB40732.1 hypothetical protein FNZ23_13515 [Streptomyces benahoarensis]
MSYPNQNPYSQPPAPQPGYGYPQQPPAPYGPYPGGGMQRPPLTGMPGGVKAARVLLFVLAGLNLIGLGLAVTGLGAVSKASHSARQDDALAAANLGKGLLIALIVVITIFTVLAVALALQFASGSNGVRIGATAFGAATLVVSFAVFPLGLIHTVMGILVIAFTSKEDAKAWFNRPRY